MRNWSCSQLRPHKSSISSIPSWMKSKRYTYTHTLALSTICFWLLPIGSDCLQITESLSNCQKCMGGLCKSARGADLHGLIWGEISVQILHMWQWESIFIPCRTPIMWLQSVTLWQTTTQCSGFIKVISSCCRLWMGWRRVRQDMWQQSCYLLSESVVDIDVWLSALQVTATDVSWGRRLCF